MAQIIVMPALGNTVESCLMSVWSVSVGDTVDEDTNLCEIETDKSTMDVPAGVSGTVLALLVEEGDDVPVKSPIAVVGGADENAEAVLAEHGLAPQATGEGGEVDEGGEDDLTPSADESGSGSATSGSSDSSSSNSTAARSAASGRDSNRPGGSETRTDAHGAPAEASDEELAAGVPEVTGEGGEVDEDGEDPLAPSVDADATQGSGSTQGSSGSAAGAPSGAASPRARHRAEAEGVRLENVGEGTGPHGRIIERDVEAALAAGPRPTAGTKGEDLSGVAQGTAIGGRVGQADLAASTAPTQPAAPQPAKQQPAAPQSAAQAAPAAGEYTETPLKGVRKIIAERMINALATSAQLSYDASADAAGLLALRKKFKASPPKLGYNGITLGDLVCFATVQVLRNHANLNAHLVDGALRTFTPVHLGLAVDTPRGLLVPTIRNADALSVRTLSDTTKELAGQAREGKIDPALLSGATFTVSNLGSFGIESFTPIVNVPQTGILGVNTITHHAVLSDDGTVGVQQRISFSLTADHQVVDGADAGRFLADLVRAIEHIDLTVLG
ncbi:dihydrolipoamide acetyltransferase family protein [Propioniciclava soli]|uniref:dihydrolipoamide acetyltransferase family protein n=1 Tax=Propioniciclava soli TaxID=2775081 RepID=UPI001E2BCAF3|nr:dihydrolipoamide acetyltransferase family protein [Propioniciclava soli]